MLWEIRVPRVVLAALVGAMLAVAGATYQGVFRNPLADPYLLGVAAGAGLGATFAIVYLPDSPAGSVRSRSPPSSEAHSQSLSRMRSAARRGGERDAATFVLAGVTVSASFTAWQTFVQQQNSETLQEVYRGSSATSRARAGRIVVLIVPYVAVALVVILVLRRVVDVLNWATTRRRASASTCAASAWCSSWRRRSGRPRPCP